MTVGWRLMNSLAVLTLALCGACAGWTYPEHGGEAVVGGAGIIYPEHRGEPLLAVAKEERLPAEVRADLAAIKDAIRSLPLPIHTIVIEPSPSGRSLIARSGFASRESDPEPPSGVWIWPNWRDAETKIHIADFSRAKFVSSQYATVWREQDSLQFDAKLIDLSNPDRRFNWFDKLGRADQARLRIAPDGRWLGVRLSARLVVGQIDPDDEDSLLHGTMIKTLVENAMILHDGSILAVEFNDSTLRTFSADGSRELDSAKGYYMTTALGQTAGFLAVSKENDRWLFVTVSSDGELNPQELPSLTRSGPYSIAPSGRFVICFKRVFPGHVISLVHRTPKADRFEQFPPLPKDAPPIGWLSWD